MGLAISGYFMTSSIPFGMDDHHMGDRISFAAYLFSFNQYVRQILDKTTKNALPKICTYQYHVLNAFRKDIDCGSAFASILFC